MMAKLNQKFMWAGTTLVVLSIFVSILASGEQRTHSSIAAGNPSGLYYPYAGGLARLWSEHIDDFNAKAEVTDASLANVIQVAVNESEVGFAQGDVVMDAYFATGKFTEALPISVLFALYPNVVHVMADANSTIDAISDLRGKTISVGAPGAGTTITALNILNVLGVDLDELNIQYLDYSETANALRDGFIDAGFIVGGVGVAVIVELAFTRDIKLVPFSDEDMELIHTFSHAYTPFTIAEGVYRNVSATQVPSVWNVLVVHQDMSEQLAYELTKTTFENKAALCQITYISEYTTPEVAYKLADIPLHPGAHRYFTALASQELSYKGDTTC